MTEPLAGRTAAVSGASSGIGLATAARLHALGADVLALARRRDAMAAALPAGVTATALDVTDPVAARAALRGVERLDLLVAAAGTNVPGRRLDELDAGRWREVTATTLDGVFHLVAAALPALRAARGLVVVIGSVSGDHTDHSGPAYQAAKAGAHAFARAAALEEHERGTGVRFTIVAPGMVETPMLDRRPEPPPPEQRARMLRPEHVADVVAFLAQLPPEVSVPELTVLPTALQAPGGV